MSSKLRKLGIIEKEAKKSIRKEIIKMKAEKNGEEKQVKSINQSTRPLKKIKVNKSLSTLL